MDALPRVKSVSAAKNSFVLNIEWADGKRSKADLTGLVHSHRHFKVFAKHPNEFREVAPDEFGSGIEWKNGVDYSASTLQTLVREQCPLKGSYLTVFEAKHHLNTAETAHLFDVTDRTIQTLRKAEFLPKQVCIALRRFESDPVAFAAHFRPILVNPRGRPKSHKHIQK